ncbi:hypothetical protein BDV96DRAFT_662680 [Lophiotrema nucula]|uniref:Uncharacterized protein n=1 Tax=Lophiotrema nucula TaxID=690887 RepID=A0A6A5ZS62_9PLEO|nr:hypothetical protein BDV96DRAFT_662680 [Lophiotrema nucula]
MHSFFAHSCSWPSPVPLTVADKGAAPGSRCTVRWRTTDCNDWEHLLDGTVSRRCKCQQRGPATSIPEHGNAGVFEKRESTCLWGTGFETRPHNGRPLTGPWEAAPFGLWHGLVLACIRLQLRPLMSTAPMYLHPSLAYDLRERRWRTRARLAGRVQRRRPQHGGSTVTVTKANSIIGTKFSEIAISAGAELVSRLSLTRENLSVRGTVCGPAGMTIVPASLLGCSPRCGKPPLRRRNDACDSEIPRRQLKLFLSSRSSTPCDVTYEYASCCTVAGPCTSLPSCWDAPTTTTIQIRGQQPHEPKRSTQKYHDRVSLAMEGWPVCCTSHWCRKPEYNCLASSYTRKGLFQDPSRATVAKSEHCPIQQTGHRLIDPFRLLPFSGLSISYSKVEYHTWVAVKSKVCSFLAIAASGSGTQALQAE